MAVVVLGSLNMDLVAQAPRLPRAGETVPGTFFRTAPGGKGANQAAAAARLGATVRMYGRVGDDAFGRQVVAGLTAGGVDAAGVVVEPDVPTGVALIVVDARGENQITVVPGANARVDATDVARCDASLAAYGLAGPVRANHAVGAGLGAAGAVTRPALARTATRPPDVLLLQLEIPAPAVLAAARAARVRGAFVILDPAPMPADLDPALLLAADLVTPNATEAAALLGLDPADAANPAASAEATIDFGRRAAVALRARGAAAVVVTLGAAGAVFADAHGVVVVPPCPSTGLDSVAAGDAFNGGVAAALAQGVALEAALRRGAAAGALAASRAGAQESLPSLADVDRLLARLERS